MRKQFTTRDITTPLSGLEVSTNNYWMCEEGDPTRALFFGTAPQCNRDKRMLEWGLNQDMYRKHTPFLTIVFVEIAYVPQRH